MKVCIIGHTERNYLPYMEKYVRFFEENGVDYTIVCWQREEHPDAENPRQKDYFEAEQPGAYHKIRSYLRFKKYVLSVLKEGNFDRIVVLTTVPAVFLKGVLTRQYAGKYLFDIRDYSFEGFPPYRAIVNSLIRKSAFTTISSEGFYSFLDENEKIVMNHNITWNEPAENPPALKEKQVISIGFVGGVRYFEENTALIEKLKNTFRYQLWYIGKPAPGCDLESYCKANGVTNASFIGKYRNEQKPELYRTIDMINSIYGSDSLEVTTALPNRLYEACLFQKPIISSKGTYLGDVIEHFQLGLAIDVENDDVKALLDNYVEQFDPADFSAGCSTFLQLVRGDEEKLKQKLNEFIAE